MIVQPGVKRRSTPGLRRLLLLGLFIPALSSCLIVKKEVETRERVVALSPKPTMEMADEIVHSETGDMVAKLPLDWFFLDVKEKVSSNIFAVAVNPDYTLSLVFSHARQEGGLDDVFENEGLIGVARESFLKRQRKTAGAVKRIGTLELVTIGTRKFGVYEYSNDNGATVTRVSVFRSSLNNFYEFAIVQHPETGRTIPSRVEIDNVFSAVMSTIVY